MIPTFLNPTERELLRKDKQPTTRAARNAAQGVITKCPFCRSEQVLMYNGKTIFYAQCTKCEAEGPVCSTSMEAMQKWNEAKR
jgi:Restriction alleviation protein Lar